MSWTAVEIKFYLFKILYYRRVTFYGVVALDENQKYYVPLEAEGKVQ